MRALSRYSVALILPLALAACSGDGRSNDSERSGPAASATGADAPGSVTRNYDLSGFTGVTAAGPDRVIITRGDRFSVTATGSEDALGRLQIQVDGDDLTIGRRAIRISLSDQPAVTVRITMPQLSRLAMAGSGNASADAMAGDAAEISVAGASEVDVRNIEARSIELNGAGAGLIKAAGRASRVEVNIAGAGDVEAATLAAETAEVSTAGSGSVTLSVSRAAEVSTLGSGDITITGGARCDSNSMGSGTINCS
jgi:hypothetical protein